MIYSQKQFSNFLFKQHKLSKKATFYVAFSGGIDSTVLLHLANQAQEKHGFKLKALHVNHNLCEQSADWLKHCLKVCDSWGIELLSCDVSLPNNSESLARAARYRWFAEQLEQDDVLLIGHHNQDRAETLLFNLMRGAGSLGLSSMREKRQFQGAFLLRPLLQINQKQIEQYAQKHQLEWVEDPSNQSDRYTRNKIRQTLIPAMLDVRPDALSNIVRTMENLQQESDLLSEVAISDLVEVREFPKHPLDQSVALCVADIEHLSNRRRANLLRFWLRSLQLHTPTKYLLGQLLVAINMLDQVKSTAIFQESGYQFRFFHDYMYVMPVVNQVDLATSLEWEDINQPVGIYDNKLRVEATNKLRNLIEEKQPNKISLKTKTNLKNPKALQGHSLNVKKWFNEIGVPPWRRQALPILTLEQTNKELVVCPVDQQLQSDWLMLECPV